MVKRIDLYKKIEETVHRYDMLKAGDTVLVGVSGGPDSVFLLYALYHISMNWKVSLIVANLDHGLRGRASQQDSKFVKELAKDLGIKCIHKRISPSRRGAESKLSIEEAFRKKRYAFFKDAARRVKADILATGHTLDDQAQTVLMRVLKGSTMKGLVGILPTGRHQGLKVIRPIIEIEKQQILNFLAESNISYRHDKTNSDIKYLRNAVRRRVMPYLSKYNPRLKRSLAQMADSLREDYEFIQDEKKKRAFIRKNGNCCSIDLKDIVVQPKALQREILRDALISSGASVKKLTYRHWKDMDNFLKFKRTGQALDLPGGVTMERGQKAIRFSLKH